jgi:hypothetical protein
MKVIPEIPLNLISRFLLRTINFNNKHLSL